MSKKWFLFVILLLMLGAGLTAVQSSPTAIVFHRYVPLSGGASTSANYALTAVVGQPATDVSDSANYTLRPGFLLAPAPTLNVGKVWISAVFR